MARMGHDDDQDSAAELLNPASWNLVVWAWIMLFVVGGTGMVTILYQPSVEAERPSAEDRRLRRSAPPRQTKASQEEADGDEYQPHPEAYRDQGRGSGGGQGSSGGFGGNQARSEGDWDRSEGLRGQQQTQFPKVFSGRHKNRTTSFKSPGKIKVEWTTTGPILQVYVRKSSGGSAGVVVSESGLSGTSSGEATVSVDGEIYFKVNSLGNWELKVDGA